MVQGKLEGNADVKLYKASKIEEAQEGSICFFANPKYESYVYTTKASAILVSEEFSPKEPIQASLIRVKDVYQTVALLMEVFEQKTKVEAFRDPTANIHPTAQIGEEVSIGAFCVISAGVQIGNNVVIHPQVFIGEQVKIGDHCVIYPGTRIHRECVLGNHCILNYNVVLGSEGFGFAPTEHGTYKKIPQLGNVQLMDYVEIGSNTCIDRGSMGSTTIGMGSKLDNLIQIAHNVQIGENTVIAAQTGIAGSSKIGNNCVIGGQVGIIGHIEIADGSKIQAQSGVAGSLKDENGKWYGSPAIEYGNYLKSYAEFKNLSNTVKKIRALEKELEKLKDTEN